MRMSAPAPTYLRRRRAFPSVPDIIDQLDASILRRAELSLTDPPAFVILGRQASRATDGDGLLASEAQSGMVFDCEGTGRTQLAFPNEQSR